MRIPNGEGKREAAVPYPDGREFGHMEARREGREQQAPRPDKGAATDRYFRRAGDGMRNDDVKDLRFGGGRRIGGWWELGDADDDFAGFGALEFLAGDAFDGVGVGF